MTQHSNQDPSKAFAHTVALAKTGSAAAFEELRERYGITTAALVEHGAELSAQGDLLLQTEAQVRVARLSLMLVIQRDTIFDLCNRVTALEQLETDRQTSLARTQAILDTYKEDQLAHARLLETALENCEALGLDPSTTTAVELMEALRSAEQGENN